MSAKESKPRSAESYLAWARLWARYIDLSLYVFLIGISVVLFVRDFATLNQAAMVLLLLPPALVVDAVVIGRFGTSIGKLIAGVRVVGATGESPGFGASVRRNVGVYFAFGVGVGFIAPITLIVAYFGLRRTGSTWWDRGAGTQVVSAGSTPLRTINAALVYVALVVGSAALAASR